ncbi:MAG: multidrug effflux MFS transporter [Hyphomicrobiales bacterium]|nr:multidrug effflux MFS transporter [Hyphomicrobiales bacterium]
MNLRPNTPAMTAALAFFSALGPLSTDMYLPSLPSLSAALGATPAQGALTLSLYIAGFAVGQVIYGPLSDRFGRRPAMLGGIAVYVAGALACAAAPSAGALIAARFAQALGGAAPTVLTRAIIRDLYSGRRAARELARTGAVMGLAPALAPTFGGFLQEASGWRSNFVAAAVAAVAMAAVVVWLLPETRRAPAQGGGGPGGPFGGFAGIARDPAFRVNVALMTFAFGGVFAWLSASSFVLQGVFGLGPVAYGLAFGSCAACYATSALFSNRVIARLGTRGALVFGVSLYVVAGFAQLGLMAWGWRSPFSAIGPMMLYLAGNGIVGPLAVAGCVQPFPDRAGAASSLAGLVQTTYAALIGVAVGAAIAATPLALPIALALNAVASALALAVSGAARRGAQN